MNKKVRVFELSPQNLQIKNVLMNDFVVIDVWAISDVYPNRNDSHFTVPSMEDALPSFYNKPALGRFKVYMDDFGAHDSVLSYDKELQNEFFDYTNGKCEVPLGVIRESDLLEIVKNEETGETWIHFTCALWTKYGYRQLKRLLKDGEKKISVEVEILESHEDEKGIEVIDKFVFDGFTILGSDVREAIPGAHLTIQDKITKAIYQEQKKQLTFAYKGLEGDSSVSAKIDNINISNDIVPISPEITNEGTEEIEMKDFEEKEESKLELTNQQKRDILDIALHKYLDGMEHDEDDCVYGWVSDLSENDVYYNIKEETFRAPYTIEDGEGDEGLHAVIKFDEAVRVMRSWQEYAEKTDCAEDPEDIDDDDDDDEDGKKEDMACKGNECDMAEDNTLDKVEDKTDEKFAEDNTLDKVEDKTDELFAEGKCEDNCDGNCKAECTAETFDAKDGIEEAVVNGETTPTEEVVEPTEEINEDLLKKHDEGSIQGTMDGSGEGVEDLFENEAHVRFTVKEKDGTDKVMTFATADEVIDGYKDVLAKLWEAENKLYEAESKLNEKVRDELIRYADELVDAEENLSTDTREMVRKEAHEKIQNGYAWSQESVEKELDRIIADALYAELKAKKKEDRKEFSASVIKPEINVSNHDVDDVAALKNAAKKLRNI